MFFLFTLLFCNLISSIANTTETNNNNNNLVVDESITTSTTTDNTTTVINIEQQPSIDNSGGTAIDKLTSISQSAIENPVKFSLKCVPAVIVSFEVIQFISYLKTEYCNYFYKQITDSEMLNDLIKKELHLLATLEELKLDLVILKEERILLQKKIDDKNELILTTSKTKK